jgi:hypothetical protein
VAEKFIDTVYRLHGLPSVIVSDRDPVFTSKVWQALFKLSDTKMNMSTANHPQTDGQTEKLNQCLETYLRCAVHATPTKWARWLPLAEYWYNTNYHSALGKSLFQVLHGYQPRHLGIGNLQADTPTKLASWLDRRQEDAALVKQHLMRAQQRMKHQEDKKRSEREFQVGDQVYMKLQPYVQMSVARRANQKLSFKYFGPYEILARIGKMAYKLKLPAGSKIHPVLHVSQLKKLVPPDQVHDSSLSFISVTNDFTLVCPSKVLRRRQIKHGHGYISQALIAWEGAP